MSAVPVAVLGLGGMGGGMARALLRAGFPVTVHNRTAEKAEALVAEGAVRAASAGDAVADAEVVVLSLADEAAVDELLFGEVVWRLKPGTVVLDTTTVSPSYARNTAMRVAASGAERLETCVVGNPAMASRGDLRVYVSGAESAVERVRPVLEAIGQEVSYLGAPGRASALKLALNLVLGVQTAALAEATTFAEAAGLPRDLLLDVVLNSGWRSPVLAFRAEFMRRREYQPAAFRAALMGKDLDLVLQQAEAYQLALPVTRRTAERFTGVVDSGRGDEDAAVIVEVRP